MAKDRDSSDRRDPRRLLDAVSQAIGYDLDPNLYEDMLIIQKGAYILNSWGIGPKYDFSTYIEGPYSTDLARDCRKKHKKWGKNGADVPDDVLRTLSRRMISDETHISKSFRLNEMANEQDFDDILEAAIGLRDALDRFIKASEVSNVKDTAGKARVRRSGDKESRDS